MSYLDLTGEKGKVIRLYRPRCIILIPGECHKPWSFIKRWVEVIGQFHHIPEDFPILSWDRCPPYPPQHILITMRMGVYWITGNEYQRANHRRIFFYISYWYHDTLVHIETHHLLCYANLCKTDGESRVKRRCIGPDTKTTLCVHVCALLRE